MPRIALYVCICLVLAGGGCGSDSTGPAEGGGGVVQGNPDGVLLPGAAGDNALGATYHLPPWRAAESEIEGDFFKTRLEAMISPTATVGEVNGALVDHNARIISMTQANAFMSLKIESVSTPDDARALGDTLVATGAFLAVMPAFGLSVDALPKTIREGDGPDRVLPPSGGRLMTYAKKAHMPAAWNARDAMSSKPIVLVPDSYADLNAHAQLPGQVFTPGGKARQNAKGNHGFHVCGTLGGLFDGTLPTGAIPAKDDGSVTILSLADKGMPWLELLKEIVDQFPASGRFIMNTSLGYNDPTFSKHPKTKRALHAMYWRTLVSGKNSRFLHATSAGNTGETAGDGGEAAFNSPFTATRLFDDLRDIVEGETLSEADSIAVEESWQLLVQQGVEGSPQNIIVVGSSDTLGVEAANSSRGADLRMVGEEVWSACKFPVTGPSGSCDGNIERKSGTSMAAPQIAGLAAYMWSIDPILSISQTINLIKNAYDNGPPGTTNAYMSLLSVDRSLTNAPVRREILDVAGEADAPGSNNKFDHHDLFVYLNKFESFSQAGGPADFSRWDLNGDGLTGSILPTKMDLTADPIPQFGIATTTIEGKPAQFNEGGVTDFEALCYYAYSPLYTGDPVQRRTIMKDCGAFTTPGGGLARVTSPSHRISCTVQAGPEGGSGCDPADPCFISDPFDEFSDNNNYTNDGNSTAACGEANGTGAMKVDAQTDADPVSGLFSTLTATVMSSANVTADSKYPVAIVNNTNSAQPATSAASWRFKVEGEPVTYTLTGSGDATSNVVTGGSGFARILFREVTEQGAFIRDIKDLRMSRGDSDSWSDAGTLEPGFYAISITAIASISVTCNDSALNSVSNGQFTFTLTP